MSITLNLSGIKIRDNLQLSVSQGGLTAGPYSIGSWAGSADGGTISIVTNRSNLKVAPDSVRFWVDLSASSFETPAPTGREVYDRRIHELIFLWDMDDGASDWDAPVNVLAGWKNRSAAKGHFVTHAYTQPRPASGGAGTGYNPSVLVIEPSTGRTATASVELFVEDPNTVYAGVGPNRGIANTVCISTSGDFTGAPAGAAQITASTIDHTVLVEYGFYNETYDGPKRILFRRGEVFDMGFNSSLHYNGLFFGDYGTGDKPVLRNPPISNPNLATHYLNGLYGGGITSPDVRWSNVRFWGYWDSTTTTYSEITGFGYGILLQGTCDLVVSNCEFDNMPSAMVSLQVGAITDRGNVHVDNCIFRDLGYQYPLYIGPTTNTESSWSMTGCRVTSRPDAINVGGVNSPFRASCCPNLHFRGCDFYHTNHVHRGIRLSGAPLGDGYNINVHSNSFEGGGGAVTMNGNATDGINRSTVYNAIYDGNVWVGHYAGESFIQTAGTGITIRNNLAIMPDVPYDYDTPNSFSGFVKLNDFGGYDATIVGAAPICVYNNTFVCERAYSDNDNKLPEIFDNDSYQPGFTNFTAYNNILYMPNMIPAANDFWPLATDTLWTPRNPGLRPADTKVLLVADHVTPSNAVKSYRPLPGSAALGAALMGDVSYMDITLQKRPEPPSMGAWEAD